MTPRHAELQHLLRQMTGGNMLHTERRDSNPGPDEESHAAGYQVPRMKTYKFV